MEDLVGGGRLGNRHIRGADWFGSCRSWGIDFTVLLLVLYIADRALRCMPGCAKVGNQATR
jgi:hypothetical protein